MPLPSAFDRLRSFTKTVSKDLFGADKKACDQFDSFERLIQAFGSDGRAYTTAYLCFQERYIGVARQVARNFGGRDEEVVEALDDALIAVWQRIRQNYRFADEAHFRNFVWRVLKNKLIDQQRVRPGPLVVDVDGLAIANSTNPDVDYVLMDEAVTMGLQNIPKGCREKLLWVATGYSYAEIAAWKNSNPDGMKHQIRECREKLKVELLKLGITVDWPRKQSQK